MNTASRGVILAVAAVILGIIILGQGFDDPGSSVTAAPADDSADDSTAEEPADDGGEPADDSADDSTAEEPADDGGEPADDSADDSTAEEPADDGVAPADDSADDSTQPPDILHDPAEVRVLVVNGTTTGGAAGQVNNDLIALGYNGLTPTNTNPIGSATATSVYYEDGYELDAVNLAQALNAPPAAVAPLPDDVPVDDLLEANVVIILGPDLVTGG